MFGSSSPRAGATKRRPYGIPRLGASWAGGFPIYGERDYFGHFRLAPSQTSSTYQEVRLGSFARCAPKLTENIRVLIEFGEELLARFLVICYHPRIPEGRENQTMSDIEVKRKKGESFEAVFRRFSRRQQQSGKVLDVRAGRYFARTPKPNKVKASKLRSLEKGAKREYLLKTGKVKEEDLRKPTRR